MSLLLQSGDDPNFEHAHEFVDTYINKLEELWRARADEVNRQSIWTENKVALSTESNEVTTFSEDYIRPGGVIRVPVDDDTASMKLKYQSEHNMQSTEEVTQVQKAMCQMISSCDVDNDCSIDLSQKKSVLHLNYIELEISKDIAPAFRGRHSVEFELRVEQASGAVIVRHYSLDTTKHRQKRYKQYKSYSKWSQRMIPRSDFFPHYWQIRMANGCKVGCGPVAWAMVFGYYDIRSHKKKSSFGTGSQSLYGCGSDGTSGKRSCVAPSKTSDNKYDKRLRKYIEHIHYRIGTWCHTGATPAHKMDRIKGFFQVSSVHCIGYFVKERELWF